MTVHLRPFAPDDVDAAGELLAWRHRAHLVAEPLLAARFAAVESTRPEVLAAWHGPHASGAVAYDGDTLVGYLLGSAKPEEPWGPNIWVEAAGLAVAEPEIARDLYGLAAQRWVDEGRTAHYVLLPAYDRDLVDAWSRLAFGHQHAHAVREAPTQPYVPPAPVTIRRSEPADIPVLAALDRELPLHQGRSPVFASGLVETLEESAQAWAQDIDDPAIGAFVAVVDGRVVGSAVGVALTTSSTHGGVAAPDDAGFLGFAAVDPAARGLGAGRALGEAVLWWAAESGFPVVVTDWRVTNLLSSRTWPRLGFRPSFVRMHRITGH